MWNTSFFFFFFLIYRLCQINRHQKRMTVLYRKQWSICLDGNLSLTASWWKSSWDHQQPLMCWHCSKKLTLGFSGHGHWVNTKALYLYVCGLFDIACSFAEDGLLSVSLGLLSAAGFGVGPLSLSSKSYRFNNLIVCIKCFRS